MAKGKGKGNRPPAPGSPEAAAVDADLALFSSFIRGEERKVKDAKHAAREERRQADEHALLVKAKEDAAAQVKRLRERDGASAGDKAAADEAYRVALAAVVAVETGSTPAWAPEPVAVETPEPETTEPETTEPDAAESEASEPDANGGRDTDPATPADEPNGDPETVAEAGADDAPGTFSA